MTRPHVVRMARRAREIRTTALLRDAANEVRAEVESGDWTIDRARAAYGLAPLGPAGDETGPAAAERLGGAMTTHDTTDTDTNGATDRG